MRTATVRDLRYRFTEIEATLRHGDEILITKRKHPIARLKPEPASSKAASLKQPDFAARMTRIFGPRRMAVSNADLVREARDERA